MLKYPARYYKNEDGLWAKFIDFPDAATQGNTMEELVEMAEDVISAILEYRSEENREIPEPANVKGKNIIYIDVPPHIALPILLRKARLEKGLSQTEISQKINRKYQTYQRFENIKNFNVRIKTLEKIAKALDKKIIIDLQ